MKLPIISILGTASAFAGMVSPVYSEGKGGDDNKQQPNILFILADDMGYGLSLIHI